MCFIGRQSAEENDPAIYRGKLKGDLLSLGGRAGRDADINAAAPGQPVDIFF